MAKYKLTQKAHEGATKVSIHGKEYTVKDGIITIPDDANFAAHESAKLIGAEPYFDAADKK